MEELKLTNEPKKEVIHLTNEEKIELAFRAITLENARDLAYRLANDKKQAEGYLLYSALKYWFTK